MGGSIGDLVKNVVTLGGYGQKKAQEEASRAQYEAEMRARKIAAERKPMEETATMKIDTGVGVDALGSLGLMIEPDKQKRKSTGIGTASTGTGLGFGV